MKQLLVTIIIICNVLIANLQPVSAQEQHIIDSLLICLEKSSEDTNKVKLLNNLGIEYLGSDPERSKDYAMQALNLAEKSKYKKGMASSYILIGNANVYQGNFIIAIEYYMKTLKIVEEIEYKEGIFGCLVNIGTINYHQGNYTKAIEYYKKSLKIAEELGDKHGISCSLNNIGLIYNEQGDYAKAIEYNEKSLKIAEELGDKTVISACLTNIGSIYQSISNYEKAIDYYEKSLKIAKELGNKNGISNSLTNIGNIHYHQGSYDKAIEYYKKSLIIDEELVDKKGIAVCLNNIAEASIKLDKFDDALKNLEKALDVGQEIGAKSNIAKSISLMGELNLYQNNYYKALNKFEEALILHKELGNDDGIAFDYINIGQTSYMLHNYSQAVENCLKGINIAQNIGAKDYIKTASEILAKSYAKQKNFEKAYEYHVLYKETHDSIFTMESKKKIAEVESSFELERNKAEIAEKDLEILKQQSRQNILIIGFGVVVVVLMLVVFLIRISQQKKVHKLREALYMNMQKALSQQMNPHFIFNTLNSIQNYIHKNKAEESMVYLSKFADLMRKVLYYSQDYTVALKDEIGILEIYSQLEGLRFQHPFSFELEIEEGIDPNTFKIPVFLLQPLLENAIKHGLEPLEGKGTIRLKITKSEVGIICRVEDSGIGRYNVLEKTGEGGHKSIASNVIRNRLNILSKYYKKKFQFSLDDIKSETGDIIGAVSEITIPVI